MLKKYNVIYQDLNQFKEKYEVGILIDKGAYGEIKNLKIIKKDLTEEEMTIEYVVKILDILEANQTDQEREILALQQADLLPDNLRQYILKLKEVYLDYKNYQILMVIPKAEISFQKQILKQKQNNQFYDQKDICQKLSCALLGLQTLDLLGILHRDMKPQNMLIMKDGSLVLADYGTSKQYNTLNTVYIGTPSYHSPELLTMFSQEKDENKYFSKKSIQIFKDCDLYAIGQSFVFAASLILPPKFNLKVNNYQEYINTKENWYQQAFSKIKQDKVYSLEFVNLLQGMVKINPNERHSLKDCLQILEGLPDW